MISVSRLRVMLVAEESAGLLALKAIGQTPATIEAVLANPKSGGKGGMWDAAQQLGYAVEPAERVKDPIFARELRRRGIDLLLNVHSLYIINKEVLAAPRLGSYNLHPGPLPHYAGLNPVSWAIYHGETEYGVTLHQMVPQIDAGPVTYAARFPLSDADTPVTVMWKCVRHGIPLLVKLVEAAMSTPPSIPHQAQDLGKRRYFARHVPQQGRIQWSRSAREVFNFIRACDYQPFQSVWGTPRALRDGETILVAGARPTDEPATEAPGFVGRCDEGGARVACADRQICITQLKQGRHYVKAETILRSGDCLEDGR